MNENHSKVLRNSTRNNSNISINFKLKNSFRQISNKFSSEFSGIFNYPSYKSPSRKPQTNDMNSSGAPNPSLNVFKGSEIGDDWRVSYSEAIFIDRKCVKIYYKKR
jgi:hypothetical protein